MDGRIDTSNLLIEWCEAPWDSEVFQNPVLQITKIELRGPYAAVDFVEFELIRKDVGALIVSCRLDHNRLAESMFLEDQGFRFIEMIYHPVLESFSEVHLGEQLLNSKEASAEELPDILEIARHSFRSERYYIDPRLDSRISDKRYCNWVVNSFNHPQQKLIAISEGSTLIAFFITENMDDGSIYWHLNAVSPKRQGHGYGKRAWQTMIHRAKTDGAKSIRTCIVARNSRVLNLYCQLGFRFQPPQMTFHWTGN